MKKHICKSDQCSHESHLPFFSIHNHSIYSARDCLNQISALYGKAKENNFEMVITDHGNAGAWVEAYEQSKKAGKKFVAGCEFYILSNRKRFFEVKNELASLKSSSSEYSSNKESKNQYDETLRALNFEFDSMARFGHIVAIAKNLDGYHQLMEIHNRAFVNYFYKKPLTDYSDFFNTPRNKKGERDIILTSACLANQINQFILKGEEQKAFYFAEMLVEEYGNDFFIELQANDMEIQKKCNRVLIGIAKKYKIKMCIANDAHYTSLDDAEAHQILLLLQGENKITDRDKMVWQVTYETKKGETRRKKVEDEQEFFGVPLASIKEGTMISEKAIVEDKKKYEKIVKKIEKVPKAWIIEADNLTFCTEDELKEKVRKHEELVPYIDELFLNNRIILSKLEDYTLDQSNKLPSFENENETLKKLLASAMVKMKLSKNKKYIDRLKYELKVITEAGFASYFLILADVYDYAHTNNMARGIARGSAGSSLVSYLLGITLIDPIEYNFPFQRFLNFERLGIELVSFELEDGKRFNLLKNDKITVIRDEEEVEIKALELKDTDELVLSSIPKEY